MWSCIEKSLILRSWYRHQFWWLLILTVPLACSLVWQEHYYDPHSGQGYLAYRLKTVQRNTTSDFKRSSKSADQHGPKTLRETSTSEQLSGDECREAMSAMKHSADQPVVREKMKATFKHRQSMLHDPDQSSVILDHFPRFLDTPGLVRKTETSLMYQLLNVFCTMFWHGFCLC